MPTKYAHVLKTVFLAAFYAKLLPMGILFALLSIILAYWTDKVRKPFFSKEIILSVLLEVFAVKKALSPCGAGVRSFY